MGELSNSVQKNRRDSFLLDEDGELAVDHSMKETSYYTQAMEDIMLLNEAGNDFDKEKVLAGDLTPVFFGSALTNFGVQTFLETYLQFAPTPQPRNDGKGRRNKSVK